MKLKTKYPCEQCAEGTYMTVEQEWWCDKHLMYACQMEKSRLCEKFERCGEQIGDSGQAVLDMATASNEKNHKMREFIKELEEEINSPNRGTCDYFIVDRIEEIIDKYKSEIASKPAQESLAIERYQDLVDYFDDKDVAKTILGSREKFKKWLERIRWHVRKADELARKVDQKPCEDCVSRQAVLDMATVIETDDFSGNEIMKVVDVDDIKALPSVTPAPKSFSKNSKREPFSDEVAPKKCHNVNSDYADCDQFVCSNCGIELQDWHQVERSEDDGDITYHEYEFRFCPNCGARIVKEDKL